MIYHTGTTGSEAKYDRWNEAQDKQFEHAARTSTLERFLPRIITPEMDALQVRRKELQTRMKTLEVCLRDAIDQANRWRSTGIDAASVTVGHDATVLAIKAEIQKTYEEQMGVGGEISKLQGVA